MAAAPPCPCRARSQRTCPVYQQACQPAGSGRGTVHLCIGNAGAQPYDNGFLQRPAWIAQEAQTTHGYSRLTANATHFQIEAIDSATGKLFDSAVLTKSGGGGTERGGSGGGVRAGGAKRGGGGERLRLSLSGQRALVA